MNILMIGTVDSVGGAARVGWDLGQQLINQKHQVKYLVGYKKSSSNNVYQLSGNKLLQRVGELTKRNLDSLSRHFFSFLTSNDLIFGASEEILNHPWFLQADVIHCHNLHGGYFKLPTLIEISRLKPTIWTLHDAWAITAHCAYCVECNSPDLHPHFTPGLGHYPPMLWNNSRYLFDKKKEIYDLSPNLSIVTPSRWLAKKISTSILSGHRLTVIPNGIDTKIYKPSSKYSARQKLGLPLDRKIVLFVAQAGKHNIYKGGQYLEEIINSGIRKDVLFIAIGGKANDFIGKPNVISLPFVSDVRSLSTYYSASDIFLLTSVAENFPLVILEAMACGLPIVSFKVGGVNEQVVHKHNGYLAEYRNTQDLIAGLSWILNLSEFQLLKIKSANRIKIINHFNVKLMTQRYMHAYQMAKKYYVS